MLQGYVGVLLDSTSNIHGPKIQQNLRLGWLVPEVAANPWIEVCGQKKMGDISGPDGSEIPNNHLGS